MNDSYIDELLGPGGVLSSKLPGYHPRLTQIEMAKRVHDYLHKGGNLIVEAKTGTGKSFAYAIPAIKYALEKKQPVVIVTANKTLQSQLSEKDIPFLRNLISDHFKFTEVKGRNNYVCNRKIERAKRTEVFSKITNSSKAEISDFKKLYQWYEITKTGDFKELKFNIRPNVLLETIINESECIGSKCDFQHECFSNKVRKEAEESDVLVINYHIFLCDMYIKKINGKGILPKYDRVIMDESHKLIDIARDFFGFKITEKSLLFTNKMFLEAFQICLTNHLIDEDAFKTNDMDKEVRDIVKNTGDELSKFLEYTEDYRTSKNYDSILGFHDSGKFKQPVEFFLFLDKLISITNNMLSNLRRKKEENLSLNEKEALGLCEKYYEAITKFKNQVNNMLFQEIINNPDWINARNCAFLSPGKVKGHGEIIGVPIDVSPDLRQYIFSNLKSCICTSATLNAGDNFNYFKESTGIEALNLSLPSEFDLKNQMEVILARNAPDIPNNPSSAEWMNYTDEATNLLSKIIKHHNGGTLILCTSKKLVDDFTELLRDKIGNEFSILSQFDGLPINVTLEEFRTEVNSCLIGTNSLWEGIDVVGESLNSVVLCKIPFKHWSDPIVRILKERKDDWFKKYSLPSAVMSFRQGVGRLIRNEKDIGVIYSLDSRLCNKFYRYNFLDFFHENGISVKEADLWNN